MEHEQRWALICHLVEAMKSEGSWAGETHIQKCSLFLQDMLEVKMGYQFVLYLYGPYSFDLRDDIAQMRAMLVLNVAQHTGGYGPSFELGRWGRRTIAAGDMGKRESSAIDFVAREIATKNTRELERISTAFFLKTRYPNKSASEIAEWINQLKPHIPIPSALNAIVEVERLKAEMDEGFR